MGHSILLSVINLGVTVLRNLTLTETGILGCNLAS
jgi:hypothetical protein